jgi:SCY1-like protein 1
MDFLKSAVASAISKGPPFPYAFGDRQDIDQSIWTLYNGTKRVGNDKIPRAGQLLTLFCRKMVPIAAYSPSMLPRIKTGSLWQETLFESSEP